MTKKYASEPSGACFLCLEPMMRLLFCGDAALTACGPVPGASNKNWTALRQRSPRPGSVSLSVPPDGETIARQDTLLPLLSLFKFPLALAVLDKAAAEGFRSRRPVEVGP